MSIYFTEEIVSGFAHEIFRENNTAGRPGLKCSDFISSVDIVPTILDAAGVHCPKVAGHSLRDVVQGRTPPDWRKLLFAEYTSHAETNAHPPD